MKAKKFKNNVVGLRHVKIHYTFNVSVFPKNKKDKTIYWFQKGKLLPSKDIDYSKDFSSNKGFRTTQKFMSFCSWLDKNYPETVISVLESRKKETAHVFEIPMGDNWRDYFKEIE